MNRGIMIRRVTSRFLPPSFVRRYVPLLRILAAFLFLAFFFNLAYPTDHAEEKARMRECLAIPLTLLFLNAAFLHGLRPSFRRAFPARGLLPVTRILTVLGKAGLLVYAFRLSPYIVVGFVYFRAVFLLTTAAVLFFFLWRAFLFFHEGRRLSLAPFRIFSVYLVVSGASLFVHFKGPGEGVCEAVGASPWVTPVLTTEQIRGEPGFAPCFPYDLVYDDVHDVLIASCKERTDGFFRPGGDKIHNAFVKIRLNDVREGASVQILPHAERSLPDDLTVVPGLGTAFGLVQSVDPEADHAYLALDYGEERFCLAAWVPVPDEPNAIHFDSERSEIHVMMYYGELRVYPWPGNRLLRTLRIPGSTNILWMDVREPEQVATFCVAGSGFAEVNLLTGESRFHPRRLPVKAHVYDPATDAFYVSGMLEHSLWRVDRRTLAFERRIPIGFCAHVLYLDPRRRVLYLGDYSGGYLVAFSLESHREVARLRTGSVLRNMAFSEKKDRLFFGSGCGIFEVNLKAWLDGGGPEQGGRGDGLPGFSP